MLIQEFGLRQEDVAERVAKNRATITNSMRLLKLDERVQEMLIQDRLTGGHARALLSLEDGEKQYQLALKTVENHLSVREVERLVKELLFSRSEDSNSPLSPQRDTNSPVDCLRGAGESAPVCRIELFGRCRGKTVRGKLSARQPAKPLTHLF